MVQDAVDHPGTLQKNLDTVAELDLPIWISEFDSASDDEAVNAGALEMSIARPMATPLSKAYHVVFWSGNSWRGPTAGLGRGTGASAPQANDTRHLWPNGQLNLRGSPMPTEFSPFEAFTENTQ